MSRVVFAKVSMRTDVKVFRFKVNGRWLKKTMKQVLCFMRFEKLNGELLFELFHSCN